LSNAAPIAPGVLAHASGALWIGVSKTLIIADLHLGYSWAQRRKGELGPIADKETAEKLSAVCGELQPTRIVFLGDAVHAPRPGTDERQVIENVLNTLCAQAELISVRGNHDRAFAREFRHLPIEMVDFWEDQHFIAMHGDRLPNEPLRNGTLLLGHLHPSMPVKDVAGAGMRLPVFLSTPQCIVLPAFSPFARGYSLLDGLPDEFARLMGQFPVQAHIASGTRVVAIGPLESALERMYHADISAPSVFRRRR
jgi:putative SbcD/Mre11-related phosphoesterase